MAVIISCYTRKNPSKHAVEDISPRIRRLRVAPEQLDTSTIQNIDELRQSISQNQTRNTSHTPQTITPRGQVSRPVASRQTRSTGGAEDGVLEIPLRNGDCELNLGQRSNSVELQISPDEPGEWNISAETRAFFS